MENKSVIVAFKNGTLLNKAWTNIKDCCKDNKISYWTVIRKKTPVDYKEFRIVKLKF